jgi:hypothetical protein
VPVTAIWRLPFRGVGFMGQTADHSRLQWLVTISNLQPSAGVVGDT